MRAEDRIRDSLASRLELLEPGLRLAEKEVRVPNAHGAAGRMDILARDASGNFVIIEVKRHEQPARQALHELFKYIGLLRRSLGVPKHKIRCFLVSTVWHELHLPFSELLRITDYDVAGFRITIDGHGTVLTAEPVRPLGEHAENFEFEAEHDLFLFNDKDMRSRFMAALIPALSRYTFADFVALAVDYCGNYTGIFPYGVYLAMGALPDDLEPAVRGALTPNHPIHAPNADDDGPWTIHDMLMHDIRAAVQDLYTDWDRGTPGKFIGIMNEWRTVETARVGKRVSNKSVHEDYDIERLLAQYDGGNQYAFQFIASPRHKSSWKYALDSTRKFLRPDSGWTKPLLAYLHETAAGQPDATVYCNIFNPRTLIRALTDPDRDEPNLAQFLDCIVDSEVRIVEVGGFLEWTGEPVHFGPEEAFPKTINVFAPRREHKEDLARHHLTESLLEFVGAPPKIVQRLALADGKLVRQPLSGRILGLEDFVLGNSAYIAELVRYLPPLFKLNARKRKSP